MDFKKKDIVAMDDDSILVSLINELCAHLNKKKWQNCFGKKADSLLLMVHVHILGGIPGLANQFQREEI